MAGRYVPPHLRGKSGSDVKPELPPGPPAPSNSNHTLDEINNHFWPVSEQQEEDGHSHVHEQKSKTLHDSAEMPGRLALELLPKPVKPAQTSKESNGVNMEVEVSNPTESDDHAKSSRPIAVFKQTVGKGQYKFEGWYEIGRVSLLEPHSEELVRMLEQKWSKPSKGGFSKVKERTSTGWNESLSHKWAVVKLSKDTVAEKELGLPQIERLPERELKQKSPSDQGKSVNEMLAELRMKDSGANGSGVSKE